MTRLGVLLIGLGLWLTSQHRGRLTPSRARYWGEWALTRLNDLSDVERNAAMRALKHRKPKRVRH